MPSSTTCSATCQQRPSSLRAMQSSGCAKLTPPQPLGAQAYGRHGGTSVALYNPPDCPHSGHAAPRVSRDRLVLQQCRAVGAPSSPLHSPWEHRHTAGTVGQASPSTTLPIALIQDTQRHVSAETVWSCSNAEQWVRQAHPSTAPLASLMPTSCAQLVHRDTAIFRLTPTPKLSPPRGKGISF